MKKLIAILLACILLAAMLVVTGCDGLFPGTGDDAGNNGDSNGDDDNTGGSGNAGDKGDSSEIETSPRYFEFELNDDGNSYSVTKYIGTDEKVSIPSNYLDKPVTCIGDYAFEDCGSLTSIMIPDSVTSIGDDAFYNCISLTSIAIPNSVTSIGNYAFYNCISLTSITIPDSVTSIEGSAFSGCSGLESITVAEGNSKYHSAGNCLIETERKTLIRGCKNSIIPNDGSVTSIGNLAFYGCSSLKSIAIPDSVTSIGSYAFEYCYKLVEVYNLSSLNITKGSSDNGRVGYYALNVYTPTSGESKLWTDEDGYTFYEDGDTCYLIGYTGKDTDLTLPDNCNGKNYGINKYAFYYCSRLASVTIPDGVTSIGDDAFYYCSSLTSVTIGDSVTSIGRDAFAGCSNLTSVTIPDSVTSIGNYAFDNCSSLTSVTIGDSVTSIGSSAFCYCSSLASVTIGDSVTSIGSCVFSYCSSLTSVTIPDSVTSIGNRAFYNCRSLTSITIPNSVTSIGDYAFKECFKLVEVYNLSSLNITKGSSGYGDVGYYALGIYTDASAESKQWTDTNGYTFYEDGDTCYLIGYTGKDTDLTLPDSCNGKDYSIIEGAFIYRDLTSITIPNSVTNIGDRAFYYCFDLTSVHISDIAAWCGISFSGSSSNPLCYAKNLYLNGSLVTELVIPEGVTSIGRDAFYGCSSLMSVTIGNSVTSIGNGAFEYCSGLTSITIGKGVTSIGSYAFQNCSSLTSITIPDSVTSIGNDAFYECSSLTSVTIPDSVTSIGADAFAYCSSLTSITIPDSVTNIGDGAFYNCTGLTEIKFNAVAMNDLSWENYVFYNAGENGDGIKVTIGKEVTKIPAYLFCSYYFRNPPKITSVEFEEGSVCKSIGSNAFSFCSSLTTINYTGSQEEWNAISKSNDWDYNTGYYGYYTINYNYTEE